MKDIIIWCNSNEGFISALLTIMTIIISVIALHMSNRIGKLPYTKKLKVIPGFYKEKQELIIEVILINYGLMTLIIDHISIKDSKKGFVGSTTMRTPIVLSPAEHKILKIPINDHNGLITKHSMNLNRKMTIEVREYDGKVYKFNKGFPVG